MKPKYLVIFLLCLVAAGAGFFLLAPSISRNRTPGEPAADTLSKPAIPTVSVVISDGTAIATYSAQAKTAYEALTTVAANEQIPLVTKQYDFGVFVSSIGGKESGAEKAWIYFVNGKSADVGADSYSLTSGDIVEWKYMKPLF